jgi:hypothetical protein
LERRVTREVVIRKSDKSGQVLATRDSRVSNRAAGSNSPAICCVVFTSPQRDNTTSKVLGIGRMALPDAGPVGGGSLTFFGMS